jgi:hypothetical protein
MFLLNVREFLQDCIALLARRQHSSNVMFITMFTKLVTVDYPEVIKSMLDLKLSQQML